MRIELALYREDLEQLIYALNFVVDQATDEDEEEKAIRLRAELEYFLQKGRRV